MSSKGNKINIKDLKSELEDIVNEYDSIDVSDNDDFGDSKQKELQLKNSNLVKEIDEIKKRIYERLSTISDRNKFKNSFSSLLDEYDTSNSFENLKNNNEKNIEVKNVDNEIIIEMNKLFEIFSEKIGKISSNKSKYISDLMNELNITDLTTEQLNKVFLTNIESIKTNFKVEISYIVTTNKQCNNLEKIESIKNELISLFNQKISIFENEFSNFINISYSEKNINSKINIKEENNEDSKYQKIEEKLSTLLEIVNQLTQNKENSDSINAEKIDKKINEFEDKFNKLLNTIENNNSHSVTKNELNDFFSDMKKEKERFMEETKNHISSIIQNNENEKQYIINLLNKIQDDNNSVNDEVSLNRSLVNSEKLQQLEELIVKQNNELEGLLKEKDEVFSHIDNLIASSDGQSKILNNKSFREIESNVGEIISNFENKINSLEKTFVEKLETINENVLDRIDDNLETFSMMLPDSKTSKNSEFIKEIMNNISSVETKLLQNYESIKSNFNLNFSEIINKLNTRKDDSISNKIDELISDVSSIKYSTNNQFGLGTQIKDDIREIFSNELQSEFLKFAENNNSRSLTINDFEDKFNKILDTIENNNSHSLTTELNNFFSDIKKEKERFMEETKNHISSIIQNNENEKQYIINLLNKIQDDNNSVNDEVSLNRSLVNSEKLQQLEELIVKQNNELEGLLKEKDEVFSHIDNLITSSTGGESKNLSNETFREIESNVGEIISNFENKINSLEKTFVEKLETINENVLDRIDDNLETFSMMLPDSKTSKNSEFIKEIMNNISSVETKLLQNYESIKSNFNLNFSEIINKLNARKDDVLNSKIDELISDVSSIKYSTNNQFGLGTQIKDDIREIFSSELHNEFLNFIENKAKDFDITHQINAIESKMNVLMEDIQTKNKDEFDVLSNKIENIDYLTKTIYDRINFTSEEYEDIEKKMFDNFQKYEEILHLSLVKDKENFNEIKNIIRSKYSNLDNAISQSEIDKLQVLNNKLNDLERLMNIQEQEVNLLLQEKNQIIEIINNENLSSNKFNISEIKDISSIVENKIESTLKRLLESPENVSSIQKSNSYNELVQMNDKVDELSQYINENVSKYNSEYSISEILEFDIFKNIKNIDELNEKVKSIIDNIDAIKLVDNQNVLSPIDLSYIQSNINQLKYELLNIELDVDLIKYKVNAAQEVNNISNDSRSKDLLIVNKRKLELVNEIIEKNKFSLKELFENKDKFVKELENNNSVDVSDLDIDNIGLLVDTKGNLMIDKLVDELKQVQYQEIKMLNEKFNVIQDKLLDSNILENREEMISQMNSNDIDSMKNMIEKIVTIDHNLKSAFAKIDEKNKILLDEIETQVSHVDVYQTLLDKFEKEKENFDNKLFDKVSDLKQKIINFKNNEINRYKNQLFSLSEKTNKTKNDNIYDVVFYKNKVIDIQNEIEELLFQINSFEEEKHQMVVSVDEKIKYIESINKLQSVDEYIEFESNNFTSPETFIDSMYTETLKVIDQSFTNLTDNLINKIYEINSNIDKLNKEINEINKKKFNMDQKINQNNKYTLKSLNNNILFYINEQEKRKNEISLFYEKLNELKNGVHK